MSYDLGISFWDIEQINKQTFQPQTTNWGKALDIIKGVGSGLVTGVQAYKAAGSYTSPYKPAGGYTATINPGYIQPSVLDSLGLNSINWNENYAGLPLKHWLMIGGGVLIFSMVAGGKRRR